MSEKLVILETFALDLAKKEPQFMEEDALIQMRRSDRRYFVIDEVDAARLEGLRKLIVLIIEERRKLYP